MKSTTLKLATLITIAVSAIIIVVKHDDTVYSPKKSTESFFSKHPLKEDSSVIIVEMNLKSEKDTFSTVTQK